MSPQELGSLMFLHHNEHQFHFYEELEMKVAVILHKGYTCPKLQNPILSKAEKNLFYKGLGSLKVGLGEVVNTDSRS